MSHRADSIVEVGGSPADTVMIRSASPSDVAAIAALYGRMSPAGLRKRFLNFPSDAALLRLAQFAPDRGEVVLLAAFPADPATPVAEARYVPTGDGVADFAIVVEDRAQAHGVGSTLLAELVRVAERRGLARLSATVLANNTPMLRLVSRLGWAVVDACEYDTLDLEVSARGGMPGWPDDGRRRILVESRGVFDTAEVARLRAAGMAVRRCLGPRPMSLGEAAQASQGCPLVVSGTCRLAEEADEIIDQLPKGDTACDAILAAHRRRWPERLRPAGGPVGSSPRGS
jgi:GNAT superfamily N-acetyltransferase